METLFFNLEGGFAEVASRVFSAIGVAYPLEGESVNALGGRYFMATVLGVALRLENNSHDHEERYRYSIGLQRNVHVGLRVSPDVVAMVAQSIGQLLADNLDVEVARETPKGVEIYSASRAD